jgi:hypothetical protein
MGSDLTFLIGVPRCRQVSGGLIVSDIELLAGEILSRSGAHHFLEHCDEGT